MKNLNIIISSFLIIAFYNLSAQNCQLFKDINSGLQNGFPSSFKLFNGNIWFSANDGINGGEIWISDGTQIGTVMFKDINPSGDSWPNNFFEFNNKIYFSANDGTNGTELWESDGSETGW